MMSCTSEVRCTSGFLWYCTRDLFHGGPHEATVIGDEVIASWPNLNGVLN